ncbi:MAG TPA: cysteine-rich small domain-containing protein [Treponemataceae bacterium]|nr:cysteine-rich small domain-containing protein [Treponemataceae bacterium]
MKAPSGKAVPAYTRFSNTECEFYPCHGIEGQNCLFCYCPLYCMECGGTYTMANGVRDCSSCTIVHGEGGYEYVQKKLREAYGFGPGPAQPNGG